jgi:ABC-type transporter MlaC component
MRLFAILLLIAPLAACHRADEENIQARAENTSERLQQRYNELQAEAQKDVDDQVAPLDNESANFLNAANAAAPAAGNVAANAQ